MARPIKRGLDYFSLDVTFYRDIKIRKLIRHKGCDALSVYTILLCLIYDNGYYIEYDSDLPFIIFEIIDLQEDTITDIIRYCVDIGLFDKRLFEEEGVLTSSGIQARYLSICSLSRRKTGSDLPYFLLGSSPGVSSSSEEEMSGVSSEETMVIAEETPINSALTPSKPPLTPYLVHKINKKKDNDSLRSSLSPSSPPPPARVREDLSGGAVDAGDVLTASEGVALLKADRDWLLQMQRKFGLSSDVIVRWLDSFVIDCDCRGKQPHEGIADVKQHFNDWISKQVRQKGCVRKSDGDRPSPQTLWAKCHAELCQAVDAAVSRQGFDQLRFIRFDPSSCELYLSVPDHGVYNVIESLAIATMKPIVVKFFGPRVKVMYEIQKG